jgi:small-conductance mechanosensitive channel
MRLLAFRKRLKNDGTERRKESMNFGQNLYNWFLSNAQSLVLMAIVVIGIYLGFKREFSKLIGFLVVALVAVGLVFNASGVKDVLLQLFNKIIGA